MSTLSPPVDTKETSVVAPEATAMSSTNINSYMGLNGRKLGLMISTIATTGFLLFGYDQGVMSGLISAQPFNDYFPETRDNSTYQGFVTAIYEIGCLIGAVFILYYGDRLGRRRSIMIGGIIMILGVVIQITCVYGSKATVQLIIGRTITGIGNGINTSTIPTYQAECSRTANRGLLICIEGGIIAFGTCLAYWIDYGSSYGEDNFTWRFPIAFQIIFGIILVAGMYFLPESPRWLFAQDRQEEGRAVLSALGGLPESDPETQLQISIILDSIVTSGQKGTPTPFSALFTGGKTQHFRRMLLGSSSQLFQQLGGCNAVIYYFPILFESSITPGNHSLALLLGGVNMVVYSIFATVSWVLIERAGRRQLFLWGTVGQCLSMVLVFACLLGANAGHPMVARGAAVGLFTYIASFGATWLPLPWLYPAEINPLRTRARANAVSTCSNWLSNFLIVMITPVMISSIGWGTYLFFAVMNAIFIPIILLFYPETKKRSLEEIDLIFAKGFLENISYVKAAAEMPYLNDREIEAMNREYGFTNQDEEYKVGEKDGNDGEVVDAAELDAPRRPRPRLHDYSRHASFRDE